MSIAGYSTCRIRFVHTDRQERPREYSDRSLVELRQLDFADYSLRALDIANGNEEIFNIPLERASQYTYGQTPDQPDEVRHKSGTYYLWLNPSSKAILREAMDTCFEQISGLNKGSSQLSARRRTPSPKPTSFDQSNLRHDPPPAPRDIQPTPFDRVKPTPRHDSKRTSFDQSNVRHDPEPVASDQPKSSPRPERNDILVDIYLLGQHIRYGKVDDAVKLAKKLAKVRAPLRSTPWKDQEEETIIPIKVRIDSHKRPHNNNCEEFIMGVYPSSTVRELRAAFEQSHRFLPSNQHFFVNGHLAHEDSTMRDLNIDFHSLFVLFVSQL